jgi:hypothetical protein
MTWTYSLATLASTPKDQVRLAIGDTGGANSVPGAPTQLMQDEEINFFLTLRSSIFGAAAECCRTLAAQFSAAVNEQAGDTKIQYSDMAKNFFLRATEFDMRSAMGALPYVGGISVSDKDNQEDDPDRVNPQFAIGMFDSNLPIGQLNVDAPAGQTDENS